MRTLAIALVTTFIAGPLFANDHGSIDRSAFLSSEPIPGFQILHGLSTSGNYDIVIGDGKLAVQNTQGGYLHSGNPTDITTAVVAYATNYDWRVVGDQVVNAALGDHIQSDDPADIAAAYMANAMNYDWRVVGGQVVNAALGDHIQSDDPADIAAAYMANALNYDWRVVGDQAVTMKIDDDRSTARALTKVQEAFNWEL